MSFDVDKILRLPLAPLLGVQALGVRRRAQQLNEPAGPRSGVAGKGPALRLLIIGDSSAAGVGASSQESALSGQLVARLSQTHRLSWRLEAQTGATTRDTLARLSTMVPQNVDVVVAALGVNDVTRATSRRTWKLRQRQLADVLSQTFGARHIIATGLPPMGAYPMLPQPLRWVLGAQAARFDAALAQVAADHDRLTHMPLTTPYEARFQASDGYHPSPQAYALWADLLAANIREFLAR